MNHRNKNGIKKGKKGKSKGLKDKTRKKSSKKNKYDAKQNYNKDNNKISRNYNENYDEVYIKSIKKQRDNNSENIIKSKNVKNYDAIYDNTYKTTKKQKKNNKPKKVLTKKQELAKKRRKLVFKILRWLTLIAIIIAGIVYAMLSPIFNIQNIEVDGNNKISSETIISLSGLKIDQNIFNFRTSNIKENIKQNAYIDSVQISRNLPDTIKITVDERVATFMIKFGNAYVYINNQGYILEITSEKGKYPLLVGYETPEEEIQEGKRLCLDDLEKLGDILKIMDATSSGDNKIKDLITEIDMKDSSDYILKLQQEKKIVHLGDISDLGTKVLWINEFLKSEKDNEGTIYLNINVNTESPYFREKV